MRRSTKVKFEARVANGRPTCRPSARPCHNIVMDDSMPPIIHTPKKNNENQTQISMVDEL